MFWAPAYFQVRLLLFSGRTSHLSTGFSLILASEIDFMLDFLEGFEEAQI